jgi:hypothetical protein
VNATARCAPNEFRLVGSADRPATRQENERKISRAECHPAYRQQLRMRRTILRPPIDETHVTEKLVASGIPQRRPRRICSRGWRMMRAPKAALRPLVDRRRHECADADWLCLTDSSRPNSLLIGPRAATAAVLHWLQPSWRSPVAHWPRDGRPWRTGPPPSTLILHDVGTLTRDDQESLLNWLGGRPSGVQVLSLSTRSVYPLVRCGRFNAALYYRLNWVVIDCGTVGPGA